MAIAAQAPAVTLTQAQAQGLAVDLVAAGVAFQMHPDAAGAWTVSAWAPTGDLDVAPLLKLAAVHGATVHTGQATFG